MAEDKDKIHLSATPEIAKILGIAHEDTIPTNDLPRVEEQEFPAAESPSNLPLAKDNERTQNVVKVIRHPEAEVEGDDGGKGQGQIPLEYDYTKPGILRDGLKVLQTFIPFILIFVVGFAAYIFFFRSVNFNFGGIFNLHTSKTPAAVKNDAYNQLESQSLAGYNTWIKPFYYDVSDAKVLDPNVDNSGNGLTNFQKYLLNLNPKSYDTLGLGMADSEALSQGINPKTGSPLTDQQKDVLSKYFDMESVMNRLAMNKLQSSSDVAGARVSAYDSIPVASAQSLRGEGLNKSSDTSDIAYRNLDINTDIPGTLSVPSLNVNNVPIIWSAGSKNFDTDLKRGVIHYPGTAMPGQIGTSYISGHSSNYVWEKGQYNYIFSKLGDLQTNASFSLTVTLKDGKQATLHYVVTRQQQYKPTDQAQFVNSDKSVVALSTCWPAGTTSKRLVVFGRLTQVDK